MSQKRGNTTVPQPTSSIKRMKPLSFERKPDGKIFFSRSTAVAEIRDMVRLHNRVLLVSPLMTGKSTLLQMFKEDKSFDSVFHFDFKRVWADSHYGLRDEFRDIVAWELHQKSMTFYSAFEIVQKAKLKKNTLILIDDYEKPFLAHYSSLNENSFPVGATAYLREIRKFYDCLCTMSEVYILMVGFTDLAVRELDERYFQVFTFHSDDKLRNWFGVEKAEIDALPIDAEIKKEILSTCEEKFTFHRDGSLSYYLIDGVESLLHKCGIVPGSHRSEKIRCNDYWFWEYIFQINLAKFVFKTFIVQKKKFKVPNNYLNKNFGIQDLYHANSCQALICLLVQSGILYHSNEAVSSSHVIPDDTRERLIREHFLNGISEE